MAFCWVYIYVHILCYACMYLYNFSDKIDSYSFVTLLNKHSCFYVTVSVPLCICVVAVLRRLTEVLRPLALELQMVMIWVLRAGPRSFVRTVILLNQFCHLTLELALYPRLALNLWQSSCFWLLSAMNSGIYHHAQLNSVVR